MLICYVIDYPLNALLFDPEQTTQIVILIFSFQVVLAYSQYQTPLNSIMSKIKYKYKDM